MVAAGQITKEGLVARQVGPSFTVVPSGNGHYRIIFGSAFQNTPFVVATSDGGDRGAFAEVTDTRRNFVDIEGRHYATHTRSKIGFQFVVVKGAQN